ncbi:MAG: hypothetical protein NCW75_13780 [Phycisphaera sp.]|nr:MAG: hypothetical protein NCW75_13780 [Phycisphaera sp.]
MKRDENGKWRVASVGLPTGSLRPVIPEDDVPRAALGDETWDEVVVASSEFIGGDIHLGLIPTVLSGPDLEASLQRAGMSFVKVDPGTVTVHSLDVRRLEQFIRDLNEADVEFFRDTVILWQTVTWAGAKVESLDWQGRRLTLDANVIQREIGEIDAGATGDLSWLSDGVVVIDEPRVVGYVPYRPVIRTGYQGGGYAVEWTPLTEPEKRDLEAALSTGGLELLSEVR